MLKREYPKAFSYLHSKMSTLKKRKQYREWYGFSAPRSLEHHEKAQIVVPLLADKPIFAMIPDEARRRLCMMAGGGFTISLSPKCPYRKEYVLALINSKLLFWALRQVSNKFRGGWITCTKQYFGKLPIRKLDLSQPKEKAKHDQFVLLVERVIDARRLFDKVKSDREKDYYIRKADTLESQIDSLVYELYGLDRSEIALVEAETRKTHMTNEELTTPESIPV